MLQFALADSSPAPASTAAAAAAEAAPLMLNVMPVEPAAAATGAGAGAGAAVPTTAQYCLCQAIDASNYVQCVSGKSLCDGWVHLSCVGLSQDQAESIAEYV